jgi:hypothetical protein
MHTPIAHADKRHLKSASNGQSTVPEFAASQTFRRLHKIDALGLKRTFSLDFEHSPTDAASRSMVAAARQPGIAPKNSVAEICTALTLQFGQ